MTVAPPYRNAAIDSAALVIAPCIDDITLRHLGSVRRVFGEGAASDLTRNYVRARLPETIAEAATFTGVVLADSACNAPLKETSLPRENLPDLTMHLPDSGTTVSFSSGPPAFVLFLEDLTLGLHDVYHHGGGVAQRTMHRQLRLSARAAVWDNRAGRAVAYGHVEARASSSLTELTRATWDTVTQRFAHKLFGPTPFRHPDAGRFHWLLN
ncbi:MAG: hypothetical protein GF418_09385 [Chitinivibrionales bacterium]|nr:hypothetical protein [Chitinivibrionales bacterium]MBD3395821.1 hypothetical protein [Chitinivibrionales bacterium]